MNATRVGQTVTEYLLLIGIVVVAVSFMGTDFKRGIQSILKITADQLGNQAQADQDFEQQKSGLMRSALTNTQSTQARRVNEYHGVINLATTDTTQTNSTSITQ